MMIDNKDIKIIHSYEELRIYTKKMLEGIVDDISTHKFIRVINNCEKDGYSLEETINLIQESVSKSVERK